MNTIDNKIAEYIINLLNALAKQGYKVIQIDNVNILKSAGTINESFLTVMNKCIKYITLVIYVQPQWRTDIYKLQAVLAKGY